MISFLVMTLCLALSAFAQPEAFAATIKVDELLDIISNEGRCSLREAIISANEDAVDYLRDANGNRAEPGEGECAPGDGPDEIVILEGGQMTLLRDGRNENAAHTGDLDIRSNLTITVRGEESVTIDAENRDRIFHVLEAGFVPGIKVTLEKLNLVNGQAIDNNNGGAILNTRGSELTLNDVVIQNSRAANGGGIWSSGRLNLANSNISGNEAALLGGGIYTAANFFLTDSVVMDNTATKDGGGIFATGASVRINGSTLALNKATGHGGAIFFDAFDNTSQFTMDNSTMLKNTSGFERRNRGMGGALFNSKGNVAITNSTVAANRSGSNGGGLLNALGNMTLINVTISQNVTSDHLADGGGVYTDGTCDIQNATIVRNEARNGGGLYRADGAGRAVSVRNTIIAANLSTATTPDCSGDIISNDYNMVGTVADCNFHIPGGNDVAEHDQVGGINGDPRLRIGVDPELKNNSGPTETHSLLADSLAIDAGSCLRQGGGRITADQRGFAKGITFDEAGNPVEVDDNCDVGAYEFNAKETQARLLDWLAAQEQEAGAEPNADAADADADAVDADVVDADAADAAMGNQPSQQQNAPGGCSLIR